MSQQIILELLFLDIQNQITAPKYSRGKFKLLNSMDNFAYKKGYSFRKSKQ